jgi:AcrR family transcriptional regulator
MGLREDKKASARAALIANAAALFRERGYGTVSVREIAQTIPVSEATFFNYFAAKPSLIRAWLDRELEAALAENPVELPLAGARGRVRATALALARRMAPERGWLAAAWASLPQAAAPPSQLIELVEVAQREGELRADLSARSIAVIAAAAAQCAIGDWLSSGGPAASPSDLATTLRGALDLVLDGARKRHERVQVRSAVPPALA